MRCTLMSYAATLKSYVVPSELHRTLLSYTTQIELRRTLNENWKLILVVFVSQLRLLEARS
jgi:hypothetical protein